MKYRLKKAVEAAPLVLAATATILLAVLTLCDVLARNLFGGAVTGVYELSRICLCIAIFASLAEATRRRGHVTIDLIDGLLSARACSRFKRLASLALALFMGILVYAGIEQAKTAWDYGDLTPDLRISLLVFWVPILLGLTAAGIAALWQVFGRSE